MTKKTVRYHLQVLALPLGADSYLAGGPKLKELLRLLEECLPRYEINKLERGFIGEYFSEAFRRRSCHGVSYTHKPKSGGSIVIQIYREYEA